LVYRWSCLGRRPCRSRLECRLEDLMSDLVYLAIVVLFFALSIGYARVAPRL
jgi:hypothetical protein